MAEVRNCPVCNHPSLSAINTAILNGKTFRAIARDFQIGSDASGKFVPNHHKVSRHANKCLTAAYQHVQEERLSGQGVAIQVRLQELDEHVDKVLTTAWAGEPVMVGDIQDVDADGNPKVRVNLRVILAAVREARHNADLTAKLAGALPEGDGTEGQAARAALEDPTLRRLNQEMETRLAELERAEGNDKVT